MTLHAKRPNALLSRMPVAAIIVAGLAITVLLIVMAGAEGQTPVRARQQAKPQPKQSVAPFTVDFELIKQPPEYIDPAPGVPSAGRIISLYRTKVPGGWLVVAQVGEGTGLTFYPDPSHQWGAETEPN